jgi:RimJ/RimL family protein N-acetyltransferase
VGHGLGRSFVQTILDFASGECAPRAVARAHPRPDRRSQKAAAALGFREEGIVSSDEGDFVVLARPATIVESRDDGSSS